MTYSTCRFFLELLVNILKYSYKVSLKKYIIFSGLAKWDQCWTDQP